MKSVPRKKNPNSPATINTWARFAPDTLRERKMPSGSSGLRAVAWRAMKAASKTRATAPKPIGRGEQGQAGQEDALAAEQVAQPPGEQQQTAERDQVRVHHPGEAGLREAEVALDRGQRHVDDSLVEDDHQHPAAEHDERQPAGG